MWHVVVVQERHLDARRAQALRVAQAVVAQRVVLGDDDDRGRKAGKVLRAQRRDLGVAAFGGVGHVLVEEPRHLLGPEHQQLVVPVLEVGRGGHVGVGGRVDEDLRGECRPAAVPRAQRAHGGHVAAGAVAADDARRWRFVLGHPRERLEAVVERHRERVLGRHAVVDADDGRAGAVGQDPAHRVTGRQAVHHPAAAVEPDDRSMRAGRAVAAAGDRGVADRYR